MSNQYTSLTFEQQIELFWSKVAITSDDKCWLWLASKNNKGYGQKMLNGQITLAHRIAWTLPNYIIPDGLFVLHSCDNPSCVNPKHLFIGTNQENMDDMVKKGRYIVRDRTNSKGEKNSKHKLTALQVLEIRRCYEANEMNTPQLAVKYGVNKSSIARVINKKAWKDLEAVKDVS